jgi:CheY-like chemotaxis protein
VVSNVTTPRMNGVERCRRLKADDALADVPVVLLTARAGETARVECFREHHSVPPSQDPPEDRGGDEQ